ncbi:M4 family metallopeptidase [Myroides sp. DF42-4-2]|uniref:M4 family metallopeptidase n=1 Tax=unclassified Myroides TaxID=2642485 RepID=UPI00257639AB|nr:M4 family metallopeptidase [Myroides sp. DF42-4-2]MDM1407528.1 M4 family metallopeptidase [Myroides sp. DF42-4-2]
MKKNYLYASTLYVAFASFLLVGNSAVAAVDTGAITALEVNATQLPTYKPLNDYGSFVMRMDKKSFVTEQEFLAKANTLFGFNDTNTFQLIDSYVDRFGKTHNSYQHFVGQYRVDGQMFIVHTDKAGRVTSVNGNIINIENKKSTYSLRANVNKKPVISQDKAVSIAFKASKVIVADKVTDFPVETVFTRSNKDGVFVLAHKVRVDDYSNAKLISKNVFVDVEKGEIVSEISLIAHANVTGSGNGFYRDNLPLELNEVNGKFQLEDEERKIRTFDGTALSNEWDIYRGNGVLYEYDSPTIAEDPSNDVHWGLARTYDYYKEVHNRASYDNRKGEIKAFYNPVIMDGDESGFPNNAVAMGPPFNVLIFGRGSTNYNPLTALDVTGHEFTHLVINSNGRGGLQYVGESGALNEGFADIFGTAVEHYTVADADWYIGMGVLKDPSFPFMRSMKNPKEGRQYSRQPHTYEGEHWANPRNISWDNGGVHVNSGVINYWFYLVSEGGSGMTDPIRNSLGQEQKPAKEYVVSGIGFQKAEQIAYETLMSQLGPNSQYADAVLGTLTVVEDLFGADSEEYFAVYDAWYGVGLIDNPRENMGLEDFELTEDVFSMYPNPITNGELTILIKDDKGTVAFYNMAGQKVTQDFPLEKGENKVYVPQLKTGNYIVTYESTDRKVSEKIVVK